jgi:hypothetical protein
MPQKNLDIARAIYPGEVDLVIAFAQPELIDQLRPLVHPDFEGIFEARSIPMGLAGMASGAEPQPTARGFDALLASWRDWLSAWETWVITPTEFVEVDDERVLVLMSVRARSKTHQVEMPLEGANLLNIRGGKLARLEMFLDESEGLKAAGLSR